MEFLTAIAAGVSGLQLLVWLEFGPGAADRFDVLVGRVVRLCQDLLGAGVEVHAGNIRRPLSQVAAVVGQAAEHFTEGRSPLRRGIALPAALLQNARDIAAPRGDEYCQVSLNDVDSETVRSAGRREPARTPSSPTRGEITRVKATFDRGGLFAWHCHIGEHEDHEMIRPYRIGPVPLLQRRSLRRKRVGARIRVVRHAIEQSRPGGKA